MTWRQQADTTAVLWEYGYDGADQLVRAVKRATDPQATVLQRFAYGYDPAGNRLFEQIDDAVTAWTYDRLNRLVTQQAGGVLRVAGTVNEPATVRIDGRPATVDASGVFVGGIQTVPGTTPFTVTATDASGNTASQAYDVDQLGAPKTFTFDPNGNLTADGTRTFEWDARNPLVAVTVGTQRSEFIHDGQQRRVRAIEKENGVVQSDSRVLWCDDQICEDRAADGATVTRRAFKYGEQVSSGAARLFVADHLGSVTDVADASATLLGRYAYDPWGRRTVTAGGDVTSEAFTGHQWQSHSSILLAYYRGYDPNLAVWISEDPIGLTEGPNLYRYVAGNPVLYRDPLGLQIPAPVPAPVGPPLPWFPWHWLPEWLGGPKPDVPQLPPGPYPAPLDEYSKEAQGKCNRPGCKPCIPPVGTIAYRIDEEGSRTHAGVPSPHWTVSVMMQSPPSEGCRCFWHKLQKRPGGMGPGKNPPAGTKPIVDPGGGGRRIILAVYRNTEQRSEQTRGHLRDWAVPPLLETQSDQDGLQLAAIVHDSTVRIGGM